MQALLDLILLHLPPDNDGIETVYQLQQFFRLHDGYAEVFDYCGHCDYLFLENDVVCATCERLRYKGGQAQQEKKTPIDYFILFNMEEELRTRFRG